MLRMRGKGQPTWVQALVASFTEQIISLYIQYLLNRIKICSPPPPAFLDLVSRQGILSGLALNLLYS